MIKKYFKITEKTKWILYIFISILVVLGVLNLIIPVYSSKIIDSLLNKNINEFIRLLTILYILFITTNTFSFLACKSYSLFFKNTFINIHKKIINSVYEYDDKLLNKLKGRIISTVNIDIINISVMADYMFSFMHNLVLIICMLIFFIKTYVIFGVFLVIATVVYILLANYLTKKEAYYFRGQRMYLDKLINPLYNDGADFFFIDYLTRDSNQLTALNYYHINDFKKFNNNRGLELSRISGNAPASYPIYFSGETIVSWDTLKKVPELTSRAANLGLTWYSHDIGGFKEGMEDQELYLRYVQLGCFQPIFRFASTKGHYYKREPWRWDLKTFTIVKDYCTLRARLVSYLYAEGYKYHKIGTPVVQPLYYKVPEIYDEVLYCNEYYFGSELLVAPITKPKDLIMNRAIEQIYLPEGTWYDFKTGKKYIGNKRYVMFFKDEDYPVFAKSGSIIILNDLEDNINATNAPKSLEVHVFPGKNNIYNLYEDDGVSSLYKDGYYIVTRFDYNYLQNNYTLIIRPFEGKSGIIPETRNYKIRFRNTKKASDVVVMLEADAISYESYIEDNDFVIEVKDVSTVRQLTINCKGNDIEIDAVRIINEDIDSIIADIPITTTLKDILGKIMFSDKDYSDKRIAIKRLKRQGLEDKFVRVFLKLLEFTKDI